MIHTKIHLIISGCPWPSVALQHRIHCGLKHHTLFPPQITGDIEWAQTAVQAIQMQCALILEVRVELWIIVNGNLQPNFGLIERLCPNDCSGNGACINGESVIGNKFVNVGILQLGCIFNCSFFFRHQKHNNLFEILEDNSGFGCSGNNSFVL